MKKQTVLVVDDIKYMRSIIFDMITTLEGYNFSNVVFATNSDDIPLKLLEHKFNLMIIDYELDKSKYNGIELVRRLRNTDSQFYYQGPILLMFSKMDIILFREAIDSGADHILLKPFSKNELHSKIDFVMKKYIQQ